VKKIETTPGYPTCLQGVIKASSNSCKCKNCGKMFFELGDSCPPIIFFSKNVPEVTGKKDRWPLTAKLENFMPMRRLGDGKYDKQQRLGLGGKGGNGR
jgi:hypothetical protein